MRIKKFLPVFIPMFFIAAFAFADDESVPYDEYQPPLVYIYDDLSIHFLELGNKYTGDCVFIKYGDIDILIDAGSRQSSAATIRAYIDGYVSDGKLEYVIATHAHQDHIAGFYSTRTTTGIFESYEIGIIIDFPKTNSSSVTYSNYKNARTAAVERGAVHYDALQCYNNEDGAQRVYELGAFIKLEILYNYFYENSSGSENNYSVCMRIVQNENQFIFTGDLEREGEERLAAYYEEYYGGLGHCVLYKGGHHGSNTSGSEKLLAAISPDYVCICSCTGTSEYGAGPQNVFPSQGFIDRVAPYTDNVYITTLITDYANNVFGPLNGNIVLYVSGGIVALKCSDNNTKLKDTEWFLINRKMPEAWMNTEADEEFQ